MANIVTRRFVECHRYLIDTGRVRSSRQFVMELDYSPQSWSKVLKLERDVTIELIRKAIDRFNINPNYIFSGNGTHLREEEDCSPILTVSIDENDKERIIHVPVNAQAGYLDQFNDPVYIADLPTFTLPGFEFKHGTYRAFDISGDSMEPSIYQAEMVVCSCVDSDLWQFNIRSDFVYVIVTKGDVVIKRLQNNIAENGTLRLFSDNSFYEPYDVHIKDIQEIWYVKMKISPFAHSKVTKRINMEDRIDDMRSVISSQSKTIQSLNETIEKMLKKDRVNR